MNQGLAGAAMPDVGQFLREAANLANAALDAVLPPTAQAPSRLHEAMRYAVFAGGKRVRPALVLAASRALSGSDERCRSAMAGVELLHTYTLVHDDLPAMDDDDLRRGRPTCHKAFDEATAILAGDALLTLSFEVVAGLGGEAVVCLAKASGSLGTVGGQQEDLDAEGIAANGNDAALKQRLERIHRGKTAALIRACCELGAIAAGASAQQRAGLATFGEDIGLAFQIADDVLDATASAEVLGKTPGKDAAQQKLTYVRLYGLEAARKKAEELRVEALSALAPLGEKGKLLAELASYIIERKH
jgi:geranylgeranyl pyrophosphate synthase